MLKHASAYKLVIENWNKKFVVFYLDMIILKFLLKNRFFIRTMTS